MRESSRSLVLVALIATAAGAAELGVLSERTAHDGAVRSLAAAGTLLLSGGEEGVAIVWDGDKELVRLGPSTSSGQVPGHPAGEGHGSDQEKDQTGSARNKLAAVALSPDGKRAVTGGTDTNLRVYDVAAGRLLATLEGHSRPILAVAISPDGTTLASGSSDSEVRLWSLTSLDAPARVLAGHEDWVQALSFSPDGSRLASGSEDGAVKLWNVATGVELGSWKAGGAGVSALGWKDSANLVVGDKSGAVGVWEAGSGKKLRAMGTHADAVADLDVSADGLLAATTSFDGTLRVWDAAKEATELGRWTLDPKQDAPRSVVFAPDGQSLIAGTLSGRLVRLALPKP